MTAVTVEISPRPPAQEEPEGVILLDDLEMLSEGAIPGCNDDNPYRWTPGRTEPREGFRTFFRPEAPAPLPVHTRTRLRGRVKPMATTRIGLDQLPPAARAAIEKHTGPLLTVEETTEGFNSEIAARITSATGTWHIKGLRADHPRAWTQRREAAVAPFLTGLAPTLRWHVETAGWDLLGFEALGGHHADYTPNSPDLPEVAALLRRLGETPCPGIELRHAEQRLAHYAAHPDDLRHFAGAHLLHTDLNNTNVLINDQAAQGDRARLVDWAWATRGAAWLDAGYWTIWLIASGHTPASAERWAAEVPSWHTAPAEGITAFATANANVWSEINNADPDPWTLRLATAAERWHTHRMSR